MMPELRQDWLSGQWVVFSPERLRRPQQFSFGEAQESSPEGDPFAEGNEHYTPAEVYAVRSRGGQANGPGWSVRVVPNRYPALRVEGEMKRKAVGLFDQASGVGAHEVVIETPKSDKELAELSLNQISEVLETYRYRMLDLMKDQRLRHVSIFKNVGARAGASLRHAHSQIVALPLVPPEVERRLDVAEEHFQKKERNLFQDVLDFELGDENRIVLQNHDFVAFCPYASRFPFEVRVLPRHQHCHYFSSPDGALVQLAEILKKILLAYQIGLNRPAYNILYQTAPLPGRFTGKWPLMESSYRWYVEIIPRIFGLAGFELSTQCAMNAVFPEEAARFLRETIDSLPEGGEHE
ncbi:MAG: galactose-1-phosphate uridylyltransferase [Verrucomicrobiota bacterium]